MAADFSSTYTQANLAGDAAPYNPEFFQQLYLQLQTVTESEGQALGVISVMLCAQSRGDAVGAIFNQITEDQPEESVKEIFTIVREAVTLVTPFVGLPNSMPAVFGLVHAVRERGIDSVPAPSRGEIEAADFDKGQATAAAIYRGVGNSEVQKMSRQFFPDLSYFAGVSIFGHLIGKSPIFELKDAELFVASSIIALGSTRQARSHTMGSLQLGHSVVRFTAIVKVATAIANWNKRPLPVEIDVESLYNEVQQNLAAAQ